VAGVFAIVMSEEVFESTNNIYAVVRNLTTKDVVKGLDEKTLNALLYNGVDMYSTSEKSMSESVDEEAMFYALPIEDFPTPRERKFGDYVDHLSA